MKLTKNKILFIVAVIGLIFMMFQCNTINNLKETVRTEEINKNILINNIQASEDSIKSYRYKDSTLHSEIQGYILKDKDSEKELQDLFTLYKKEKNKKPKTVIEYRTKIVERIVEIPVTLELDSLNNKICFIKSDTIFSKGNSRKLVINIPYDLYLYDTDSNKIIKDSIRYEPKLYAYNANILLTQKITLTTGLSYEDKKPVIWVNTKYPGIKFDNIIGADILKDETSNKVTKHFRKQFGFGIHIGYGVALSNNAYNVGPTISVGFNYTPKFLQFGK